MDSTASRIIKARQYTAERDERISIRNLQLDIQGDNASHSVSYAKSTWQCDCEEFIMRGVCAHVMVVEEMLDGLVDPALVATPETT